MYKFITELMSELLQSTGCTVDIVLWKISVVNNVLQQVSLK